MIRSVNKISALALLAVLAAGCSAGGSQPEGASTPANGGVPQAFEVTATYRTLTQDIGRHDKAAFLKVFEPAIRPKVRLWWDNLDTIGFTAGLVSTADNQTTLTPDAQGNATIVVEAGMRSKLDPVDSTGQPMVPCQRYRVTFHVTSASVPATITSWTPLGNAPWDQGKPLYVRKAGHVAVAGYASERALVDQTLPIAATAARYDVALFNLINRNDLNQDGFIVFVSGNATVRNHWFRTGPQPSGWTADSYSGLAYPMAGPHNPSLAGAKFSTQPNGGARVVVVPGSEQPGGNQTATLVHEFVHVILDASANWFYGSSDDSPAWVQEGIARAMEDLYLQQPGTPRVHAHWFGRLTAAMRSLPASYRSGKVPTNAQLYGGSAATGDNWYNVAASAYEYIAKNYGLGQMLSAAVLSYGTGDATPFGNVLKSANGDTLTFYPPSVIKSGWARWIANGLN